jgi:hypothetical protein
LAASKNPKSAGLRFNTLGISKRTLEFSAYKTYNLYASIIRKEGALRTTLDLPRKLILKAQKTIHGKSKTETIIIALRELIRHDKIRSLRLLKGKIHLNLNIDASRGRA